jgi:putative FmdB family regulatory protein
MPIYEYNCMDCGKEFEVLVSNDKEKVVCPTCKKTNLKKLFSTFSSIVSKEQSLPSCATNKCSTNMCQAGRCPSMNYPL